MKMDKAFFYDSLPSSRHLCVGGNHKVLSQSNPKAIRHCEVRGNLNAINYTNEKEIASCLAMTHRSEPKAFITLLKEECDEIPSSRP